MDFELAHLAQALRLLTAAGQPVPHVILEGLADAVLARAPAAVRLALEVKAGGEHRLMRALELAALVLDGDDGAAQEGAGAVLPLPSSRG